MTLAPALVLTPAQRLPVMAALAGLVAVLALAELALGPVALGLGRLWAALLGQGAAMDQAILWQIRAPRLVLGLAVGATLALAGAALQGLLRNPLADPGLIGVTGGAALGAVTVIVLGGALGGLAPGLAPYALPLAAFAGGACVMALIFALAARGGADRLILAGVAVNALAGSAIGMLTYLSDDAQLRDLTFWSMGALGRADWGLTLAAAGCAALAAPVLLGLARALDLLQLGDRAAFHAGLPVGRTKWRLALAIAGGVGAVTAAAGPIGFVGLIAPHLARRLVGPGHRGLLPAAALIGMALVLAADLGVRLVVPPAEPPIGLATSLIGGPFFLVLLLRHRHG